MRFRQVVTICVVGYLVMSAGCLMALSPLVGAPRDFTRVGFVLAPAGGALIASGFFIVRRERKRSPRNAVQPSGVPCAGFLDVGSPVLALFEGKWWPGEVVAVLSGDRFTVRFDGASPFWDQTYSRAALQEPKSA
jgi:hypothetical protein